MTAPEVSDIALRDRAPATRADLPILPRSTLSTLAPRKADAVAEAKHTIERILSRQEGRP
jgi:hypothetical protein